MKFKTVAQGKVDTIPRTPGVYSLKDGKEILYIGKAANLRERVKNHFQQPTHRDNLFINQVDRIGYIETASDIDALLLESELIKKYRPRYNVMWKDDKKYFYVAIDAEGCVVHKQKLPRIYVTHQPIENTKIQSPRPQSPNGSFGGQAKSKINSKFTYIGPFVDGRPLKKVLRLLRRSFPYYTAKNHTTTKCSWCHIDRCPGPEPDTASYKRNIQNIKTILEGRRSSVLKKLGQEMKQASKKQDYERAAELRDQFYAADRVLAHASLFAKDEEPAYPWNKTEKILQKIFHTRRRLSRIEAYDISNIQGHQSTGSMVVFVNGKPAKDQYRKFKISIEGTPNDFAMMQEMIERRLQHAEWNFPNIMIIDGGKGQLSSALAALNKSKTPARNRQTVALAGEQNPKSKTKLGHIMLAAIAKKQNELFLPNTKEPILLSETYPGVFNLILHIRDEAHRFAITYHRTLRSKSLLN